MSDPTSSPSQPSAHSALVVRRGIDGVEARAAVHCLEQVVEEDRMRLAGVAAPEEDEIRLLRFTV